MFDPTDKLLEEYFSKIDGNITIGSSACPLFDLVPNSQPFPYIRIEDVIINEAFPQCRGSNKIEALVILHIFTGFEANKKLGGKKFVNVASKQVLDILRTTPLDLSPDYTIEGEPILVEGQITEAVEDAERVWTKVIQVRHKIVQ